MERWRAQWAYGRASAFSFSFAFNSSDNIERGGAEEATAQAIPSRLIASGGGNGVEAAVAEEVVMGAPLTSSSSSSLPGSASWGEGQSDLVKGVYEGGLKVWECTQDLLAYLEEFYGASCKEAFREGEGCVPRVLDLGCGHGDLGCWLARGWFCDFQDYNRSVLETVTIPRVRAVPGSAASCSRFFAGDWGALRERPPSWKGAQYDIVLTSETLYNVDSTANLLSLIRDRLRFPSGVAYVASKT